MAKANSFDPRFTGVRYRPDSRWNYVLVVDSGQDLPGYSLLDERAAWSPSNAQDLPIYRSLRRAPPGAQVPRSSWLCSTRPAAIGTSRCVHPRRADS
jgi:hypothetical protein